MASIPARLPGERVIASDSAPSSASLAVRPVPEKRHRFNSPLERLPTELLQEIFILSMNLKLPLASPRLAAVLSGEHVRLAICRKAFTWHKDADRASWSERYMENQWFDQKYLGPNDWMYGDAKLQSSLLRKEWMTLSFWQKLVKAFGVDDRSRAIPIRFAPGTQLPARLLGLGDMGESKVLLSALTAAGAGIDWTTTTSGELATALLTEATVLNHRDLVYSLLCPIVGIRPDASWFKLTEAWESPEGEEPDALSWRMLGVMMEGMMESDGWLGGNDDLDPFEKYANYLAKQSEQAD